MVSCATVVTIFGIISLNNQNEQRDFEEQVRKTAVLIEEADTIKELNRVKRKFNNIFNPRCWYPWRTWKNKGRKVKVLYR